MILDNEKLFKVRVLLISFMEGGEVKKGSDAWNVAQGFTQLKILKPLVEMDAMMRVAIYGGETLEQSSEMPESYKIRSRIEAINRLVDLLLEVIENSEFACKKKSEEEIKRIEGEVIKVKKCMDAICTEEVDQRTNHKSIRIDEALFSECLETLRKAKREIHEPLNQNNLIFPASDEIDLDKIKDEIVQGG